MCIVIDDVSALEKASERKSIVISFDNEEKFTNQQKKFITDEIAPLFEGKKLRVDYLDSYKTPLGAEITIITLDTLHRLYVYEFEVNTGYLKEVSQGG